MGEFQNYFNYFTEIEEHFQKARGTRLFLLSPLDWALIESWKNSGIPLVAVQRGIDSAFEKWRKRRIKTQKVNSLAFCAQAVLVEAERAPDTDSQAATASSEPFEKGQVTSFLQNNLEALYRVPGFGEIAQALADIIGSQTEDLEDLERCLSVLEERMIAIARASQPYESALGAKRELEQHLQPYRNKMSPAQIEMLQRQFLDRRLLEAVGLPRLSLFYLR